MDEKQALLQQLQDIKVPDPIGLWPLAAGWWLLIIVALVLSAAVVFFLLRRLRAGAYRREALQLLAQIDAQREQNSPEHTLGAVQALLKRVALTAWPQSRQHIAHLYGHGFFVLLESTVKNPGLSIDAKWHNALYQPALANHYALPLTHWLEFAAYWIKHHEACTPAELAKRLQGKTLPREAAYA